MKIGKEGEMKEDEEEEKRKEGTINQGSKYKKWNGTNKRVKRRGETSVKRVGGREKKGRKEEMDGWMDGRMEDERTDGWMDGRVDGRVDG